MKITLISNNTFSIYGGYERVLEIVLNVLTKKFDCNFSLISAPHYQCLLDGPIYDDFKTYNISRESDYKDKTQYCFYIVKKKLFGKKLLINYFTLEKHIYSITNSDIIIVTDPLLISTVYFLLKNRNVNKKIIYWDHGSLMGYLNNYFTRIIYKNEILESLVLPDAHLTISSDISNFIKYINPEAKIFMVYNPLQNYEGQLIMRSKSNIFLYIGRLSDNEKNISFLLKGLALIKNKQWKLIIVGTGKDEKMLQKLAHKLDISDRIEWLGFRKDPYKNINEVTALMLTSRWEGFPMVLVEANQRGVPVISSDCKSGPKDIVIPGVNGYLFKEGDINDFIKVVNDIIEGKLQFSSPEEISKSSKRFDSDLVISNIYNSLKKILEEDF